MTTRRRISKRNAERGSALLIVFVLAAIVAISLYMEMPIAAFEAQRRKEQLLEDRGNEYAHAIKLFVRKTGHYPTALKDLEDTNRMRFIRHLYPDPLTGKNDWRLLHAGPNGMLTDSKVPNANGVPGGQNGSNWNSNSNNSSNNTGFNSGNNNNNGSFGNSGSSFANNNGSNGGNSSGFGSSFGSSSSGGSGFGGGFGGSPSTTNGSGFNNASGNTSASNGFGNSASSNSFGGGASSNTDNSPPDVVVQQPRQRAPAVAANGSQTPTASQADIDTASPPLPPDTLPNATNTATGAPTPNGTAPNGGQNNATGGTPSPGNGGTDLKSSMLANPSGAPSSGFGSGNNSSTSQMGVMNSGGIAGVASRAGGKTIKLVHDQSDYSLWEFFYDPTKDTAPGGVQMGAYAPQSGSTNGPPSGTSGQNSSAFGSSSSFGQSSGQSSSFGQSSFGSNTGNGTPSQSSGFGQSSFGNSTNSGQSSSSPNNNFNNSSQPNPQ